MIFFRQLGGTIQNYFVWRNFVAQQQQQQLHSEQQKTHTLKETLYAAKDRVHEF